MREAMKEADKNEIGRTDKMIEKNTNSVKTDKKIKLLNKLKEINQLFQI